VHSHIWFSEIRVASTCIRGSTDVRLLLERELNGALFQELKIVGASASVWKLCE
jgi:hypothetical protein